MAVEINILSGVRQGQRLVLDATKFRAGPDPNCEIYFDPLADSSARDRSVALSLMDDGWYIRSTGVGEVFVNQSPVVGMTRIKSGAIVRMSEFGPEFEFRILARPPSPAAQPAAPGFTPEAAPSMPEWPAQPAVPTPPVTAGPSAPAAAPYPVAPAAQELPRSAAPAPLARDNGRLAVMVGFGILGCLILLVLVKLMSTPSVVVVPGAVTPTPTPPAAPATTPNDSSTPATSPSPAPTPPAANPLLSRLSGAVLLIQVEKSGQLWPYAACCAVSENTVLTSAREALQVGAWTRDPKSGFNAWVTHPASGLKLPVREIRFYAVSVATEKPDDWMFTNLGLISVQGDLPKTAELAGPDDSAQLAQGNTVHVLGYTHEGDLITPADHFEVNETPAKILLIAAHRDLPGKPRRLAIKAELPKSALGSPVVNAQGKIVAVYCDPVAEAETDEKGKSPGAQNMHYATVINPGVIDLWLKKSDSSVWMSTADLKLPAADSKTPPADSPKRAKSR